MTSGRLITRNQWVKIPMPMSTTDANELMAKKQKQSDIAKHGYVFSWKLIRSFPSLDVSTADISSAYILVDEGANDRETNTDSDDDDYSESESDDETLIADTDSDSDSDGDEDSSDDESCNEDSDDDSDDGDDNAGIIDDQSENANQDENQGALDSEHNKQGADKPSENPLEDEETEDDSNKEDA